MIKDFVESYEILSDDELVRLAQSENHDAYIMLLRRYTGLIKSRASCFYNGSIEMEDLVQEGIIALYIAVHNYDFSSSSFSTFARLCVDRGIIAVIRSNARKKRIPHDMLVRMEEISYLPTADSPENILIETESVSALENNIKILLSKLEYKVFMLFLHNYSHEEIAKELGVSEKAVNNAVYRIRQKLKNL